MHFAVRRKLSVRDQLEMNTNLGNSQLNINKSILTTLELVSMIGFFLIVNVVVNSETSNVSVPVSSVIPVNE